MTPCHECKKAHGLQQYAEQAISANTQAMQQAMVHQALWSHQSYVQQTAQAYAWQQQGIGVQQEINQFLQQVNQVGYGRQW